MEFSALLPMVGVVVGATFQAFLSRAGESAKAKSTLRVQAYADYIACLAESSHVQHEKRGEVFARAASAKTRIAIYGSASVIVASAEFERAGGAIASKGQQDAVVAVVSAMREEGVGRRKKALPEDALLAILFKPR